MANPSSNGMSLPGQAPVQEDFNRNGGSSNRPRLPNGPTVSCVMMCALVDQGGGPLYATLPITRMTVEARCQISMGFVRMEVACTYPQGWPTAPLQLYVPKTQYTVITDLHVENLTTDRVFATTIIPVDDVEKHGFQSMAPHSLNNGGQPPAPSNTSDPELFVLALPPATAGDSLLVVLNYFQPLTFDAGAYMLRLPVELSPSCAATPDVLETTVTIYTGSSARVDYCVLSSHTPVPGLDIPGTATISFSTRSTSLVMPDVSRAPSADPAPADRQKGSTPQPNADIEIGYHVWGDDMHLSLNVSPPPFGGKATVERADPRGSFCLSVAPPRPDKVRAYPRSMVFVLDRSGSMAGEPMLYARAAVLFGLRQLEPKDTFNIIAFDHEQMWFAAELTPATPEALQAADTWITGVLARGLTDIMTPLTGALNSLGQHYQALVKAEAQVGLPFIFLLTDGCVENERDICMAVEQQLGVAQAQAFQHVQGGLPRMSTFGIGPYCNHYFLRQLAMYGRGLSDIAFRPFAIKTQMERMLIAAQRPVLSDVSISVPGVESQELYPNPLPDLFCGQPLLIAGKYEGEWPAAGVTISGRLPDGSAWTSAPVQPAKDAGLPLDPIFIKSRLDVMTANAWLRGNPPEMVQGIVDLSVASGVPCAHTRTVGFETTRADFDRYQQDRQSPEGRGEKNNYLLYALGGAAAIVVIGGVAAALAFGDAGATAANAGADAAAAGGDAAAAGAEGAADAGGGAADAGDGAADGGCCDGCCDDCDGGEICASALDGCTIS